MQKRRGEPDASITRPRCRGHLPQLAPVALRSLPPVLPAAMPLASPHGQPAAQPLLVRQRRGCVRCFGAAAALLHWVRGWHARQLRRPLGHQLRLLSAPLLLLLCTDMRGSNATTLPPSLSRPRRNEKLYGMSRWAYA